MIVAYENGAAPVDPVTAGVQAGTDVGELLLGIFDLFDVSGKRKEAKGLSAQAHDTAQLNLEAAAIYAAVEERKARGRQTLYAYAGVAAIVGVTGWYFLRRR